VALTPGCQIGYTETILVLAIIIECVFLLQNSVVKSEKQSADAILGYSLTCQAYISKPYRPGR
jgi:hypothetical protein